MRHSFTIILIISSLWLTKLYAQTSEPFMNHTWSIGVGNMTLHDSYLSPASYSGLNLNLDIAESAFYKNCDEKISWDTRLQLSYGDTYNPAKTASINYFGGILGYGSHYHFQPLHNLTIMTGAFVNIEGALKYNSRNVNNMGSGDLNTTLYASAIMRYKVRAERLHMNIQYELMTPVLGCMFIPEMGHSYYEIYENLPNDLDKVTHFSSFHNKQGIQGKFTLDFLLKNVTLRAGFAHNNQTWQGNDLNFKQSQFNILIGATYNIIRLGGKKAEK